VGGRGRQATAEDTGEDPVSEQVFESEAKAATAEKLREEEDDNNLPHGTPSWHPARAHHTAEEGGDDGEGDEGDAGANEGETAEEGEFVMEEEDESFQVSARSATGSRAYLCVGGGFLERGAVRFARSIPAGNQLSANADTGSSVFV